MWINMKTFDQSMMIQNKGTQTAMGKKSCMQIMTIIFELLK